MKLTASSIQRLENVLNKIGLPKQQRPRVLAFSKLTSISKQQASQILVLGYMPEDLSLQQLSSKLEMDMSWLVGG